MTETAITRFKVVRSGVLEDDNGAFVHYPQHLRIIEALEQENTRLRGINEELVHSHNTLVIEGARLREQIARYERAVTDEEDSKYRYPLPGSEGRLFGYSRADVDELIASRRTAGPDGEANEKSGQSSEV